MKWMFVPGLHCEASIFEGVPRGEPDLDPIFLDWPWPERLDSMDQAAGWLLEQIETHEPMGLTGHSLGGVLSLYLHVHHGVDLPLVILDAFFQEPHPFFRNHTWEATEELESRVQEMLVRGRARFPRLRAAAMSFEPTDSWRAAVAAAPAAFVYGGRSGEHDAGTLASMAGLPEPHPRVQVIEGTSHFLMMERPEPLYAAHRRARRSLQGG